MINTKVVLNKTVAHRLNWEEIPAIFPLKTRGPRLFRLRLGGFLLIWGRAAACWSSPRAQNLMILRAVFLKVTVCILKVGALRLL